MSSGITIVCREVCRQTGAVTAYICKKDVEDRDLHLVSIRGRICSITPSVPALRTIQRSWKTCCGFSSAANLPRPT